MKKIACHTLYLPSGIRLSGVVMELDADGYLSGWHPLVAEEPFVEWRSGVCVVLPFGDCPERHMPGLGAYLDRLPPMKLGEAYVVWYADGMAADEEKNFTGAFFEKWG